jgi:hypothetical protein
MPSCPIKNTPEFAKPKVDSTVIVVMSVTPVFEVIVKYVSLVSSVTGLAKCSHDL